MYGSQTCLAHGCGTCQVDLGGACVLEESPNRLVNLTQHRATKDQLEAGVFDLPGGQPAQLLTFVGVPERKLLHERAAELANMAKATGASHAMIGGYLALMGPLVRALTLRGIIPHFAHSERVSAEVAGPDGGVTKTLVFRHSGFVRAID